MNYNKYLKYKNKYLILKNQLGGMTKSEIIEEINKYNLSVLYGSEYLSDEDVIFAALIKNVGIIKIASRELLQDKNFIIKVINKFPSSFEYIPDEFKSDKEIVLKALEVYPRNIRFISKEFKNDKSIITNVIMRNGLLLEYVSDELRNDYDTVLLAVMQDGSSFIFASKELQDNDTIYNIAVRQNPIIIRHFMKIPCEIDNYEILEYSELVDLQEFIKIDSIHMFYNYIIYILKHIIQPQMYTENISIQYLLNEINFICNRVYFLKNNFDNYDLAINTFNSEKYKFKNIFLNLKLLYSKINTYFIKTITLDYSKSKGHLNVGIISFEGNNYFFKILHKSNLIEIKNILLYYNFIDKCNNINIDETSKYHDIDYNIHFVKILNNIILTIYQEDGFDRSYNRIKTNNICIGYLMEIIDGLTITDLKTKHNDYYLENYNLIEHAFNHMVTKLTEQKFLLNDLHGNNLIWNMETNTLSLIDITESSFDREPELEHNKSIFFFML